MDENKPQDTSAETVNPMVAEQLEQIKKSVPDTSQRLFDFLTANLKPILIACAALLVAVGAFEGVQHFRAKSAAKAADQLGVILIEKTDPKARIAALEGFLKDAPASLKPGAMLELAAAEMIDKQYAKAAAVWAELENSSSDDLKIVAGIGHAKCLSMDGKAKEALALLQALKTKAPEAYALPVTRAIAVTAEQAGDTKIAADAYAELVSKNAEAPAKPYFEFKSNQLKTKS
jgi:predicted negative regulator of RcsB-dependent stress response